MKKINYETQSFVMKLVEEGYLTVFEDGKVLNNRTGNFIGSKDRNGYVLFTLQDNGTKRNMQVHRLVYLVFKGSIPPETPYINHIDNNPSNNHIDNLEPCSHAQNMQHSVKQGRKKVSDKMKKFYRDTNSGQGSGMAKLTNEQAREIRKKFATGEYNYSQLGREYNIDRTCISDIINYISYKNA